VKCSNPDCNRGIGLVAYGRGWFTLSNARMRSLASLKLPIADVEIEMTGYSKSEVEHLLEQFHLVFRRGGG